MNRPLNIPGIVGIVVGTRPDCVDEEKLDYFSELSRKDVCGGGVWD